MKLNTFAIKKYLAENGLTVCAFAASVGVSRQSMSTILTRGSCTPLNAGRIALAMGVSIEKICEEGSCNG